MAENPWITRLKLALLAVIGIAIISVPVTLAVVMSATGSSSVTLGSAPKTPASHRNPAGAIGEALKCKPTKGYYALTFDDGPYPAATERLVGALRGAGAVATFFDVGERVAAHPELAEEQRSVGQVANHSYTHPQLPRVTQERRFGELTSTAQVLGHPNAWVRPPFGETDAATDADMRKTGLVPVYWTTDTYDWQNPPAQVIVERALRVAPGGVILLHDGRPNTVQAVPRIVDGLRERGMCPGFLARTPRTVTSSYKGLKFNVIAVSPGNDSGVASSPRS